MDSNILPRTRVAIAAATLMACTACGADDAESVDASANPSEPGLVADWPEYDTLGQLLDEATAVVLAVPGAHREGPLVDEDGSEISQIPSTYVSSRVDRVIRGDLRPGQTIEIAQDGTAAKPEASTIYLDDVQGRQILMLLGGGDTEAQPNQWYPLNPQQSFYLVEGTSLAPLPGAESALPLKSVGQVVRATSRSGEDEPGTR